MADIKSPRTVWILHVAYLLLHGQTGPSDVRDACRLAVAMLFAIIPEQLEYLSTAGCSTSLPGTGVNDFRFSILTLACKFLINLFHVEGRIVSRTTSIFQLMGNTLAHGCC